MDDILKVNPQMLQQKKAEVEEVSGRYRGTYSKIYEVIDSLRGTYEGEAATGFYTQIEGFRNDFEAAGQLFAKYAEFLDVSGNNYQYTENMVLEHVRTATTSGKSF